MINPEVDVFICTFNRPSVIDAVNSVLQQKLLAGRFYIHVIDNAENPTAHKYFTTNQDVTFHHAPKKNISIARNAALKISKREFLAFMDDDQIASPNWLAPVSYTHLTLPTKRIV